jgi:hypothetical protein
MSDEYVALRTERLSLCIGQILGQLSELLNNIKTVPLTNDQIYKSLLDITESGALQVHELYYKGNKPA